MKKRLKLMKNSADGLSHAICEGDPDYTICGHKWNSTEDFGWEETSGDVTCPQCASVTRALKGVKPCRRY